MAAFVSGGLVIRDDVIGTAELGPSTLVLLVPLVITNICATSLVAHKAWCVVQIQRLCAYILNSIHRMHRRLIKENLGRETKRTQAEKVLILLMESGAVYCFLGVRFSSVIFHYLTNRLRGNQILALISGLGKLSNAGTGLTTAVLSSLQPHLAVSSSLSNSYGLLADSPIRASTKQMSFFSSPWSKLIMTH